MLSCGAMKVSLLRVGSFSKRAWRGIGGRDGGYEGGWEGVGLGLLQG